MNHDGWQCRNLFRPLYQPLIFGLSPSGRLGHGAESDCGTDTDVLHIRILRRHAHAKARRGRHSNNTNSFWRFCTSCALTFGKENTTAKTSFLDLRSASRTLIDPMRGSSQRSFARRYLAPPHNAARYGLPFVNARCAKFNQYFAYQGVLIGPNNSELKYPK